MTNLRRIFALLLMVALATPVAAQTLENGGRSGSGIGRGGGGAGGGRGGIGRGGRGFGLLPGLLIPALAAAAAASQSREPPPRRSLRPRPRTVEVLDDAPPRRHARVRQGARQPPPPPPPPSGHALLPPPGETRFAPDELLVMFQGEASERRLRSFARRGQLEFIATRRFKLIGASVHRFRLARGGDLRRALQGAAAAPGVAWVQPDYYYRLQEEEAKPAPVGTPAPASSPEASLAPPPASAPTLAAPGAYAGPALHLAEAHQLATGKGVRVAVIDSQIDAAHPEIEGAVADRFDAVETGGQESEPQAHGTGMAGAIVGRKKLEGAAPAAQLLAVRAFGDRGDAAQAVSLDIAAGIDWAAEKGAKIVNMSFAGPADPLLAQMVQAAAARGLILIAAAGNDGPRAAPQYPAAYREVIAVSALDDQSRLYAQAVGGPHVALAAPGVDVLAAAPRGAYDLSTGTSIACAELSGVAALLLEREPGLSAAALRARLRAAAKPVAGVAGLGAADARATLEKR